MTLLGYRGGFDARWTSPLAQALREELKRQFPGVSFSLAVLGLLPKQAPIKITLTGSDPDLILETAEDLKLAIEEIPGADNVRLSVESGSPEYD